MAEWRKVLVSGSNAHIAAITASTMGAISEDAEVVFREESSGRFFSSGSNFNIKYTSSDGGQLYLDNIGLSAYNITASGLPDIVTNNSTVVFRHPTHGGLQTTSSLFFEDGILSFPNGAFSGSFTGDGSNLTGVVGTLPFPLTNANGIISSSGTDFIYSGSQAVEVGVHIAPLGGLFFQNQGLSLAASLAGDGLYFSGTGTNNFTTISIDLAANSGLDTSSGKLEIHSDIAGNGLNWDDANGELDIDLATNSGLAIAGTGLELANSVAGQGLTFSGNNKEVISVDDTFVVTSSNFIHFKTGSSNLTLSAGAMATASTNGFTAFLIDDPDFTYDLNTTLSGDFVFTNDLTIEGDLVVSGAFVSASFETQNLNVADQFILLNSGSSTGDGGFIVQTTTTQGAFMFYDSESARWGVSNNAQLKTTTNLDITGSGAAALVTVQITGSSEAVILNSTPLFGANDSTKQGQLVITTAPATNESSVYIYS